MADDDPILGALAIPKTLRDAVKKRECVLFLGFGVHAPPPEKSLYTYPEGGRPPLGESLSHQLADECIADLNYWEKMKTYVKRNENTSAIIAECSSVLHGITRPFPRTSVMT